MKKIIIMIASFFVCMVCLEASDGRLPCLNVREAQRRFAAEDAAKVDAQTLNWLATSSSALLTRSNAISPECRGANQYYRAIRTRNIEYLAAYYPDLKVLCDRQKELSTSYEYDASIGHAATIAHLKVVLAALQQNAIEVLALYEKKKQEIAVLEAEA